MVGWQIGVRAVVEVDEVVQWVEDIVEVKVAVVHAEYPLLVSRMEEALSDIIETNTENQYATCLAAWRAGPMSLSDW